VLTKQGTNNYVATCPFTKFVSLIIVREPYTFTCKQPLLQDETISYSRAPNRGSYAFFGWETFEITLIIDNHNKLHVIQLMLQVFLLCFPTISRFLFISFWFDDVEKFLDWSSAIDLSFVSSFEWREVNLDVSYSSVHWKTSSDVDRISKIRIRNKFSGTIEANI